MGTIKDIVELIEKLRTQSKDRKTGEIVMQISSLIQDVQRENAELREKNLDLKEKICQLSQSHSDEVASLKKEMSILRERKIPMPRIARILE